MLSPTPNSHSGGYALPSLPGPSQLTVNARVGSGPFACYDPIKRLSLGTVRSGFGFQ
jgi:hypothetical protein